MIDWETTLLVTLSLVGLGIVAILGYLDAPVVEETNQVINGCPDGQILEYHTSNNTWICNFSFD
jgi:hypothetical protein